MVSKGNHPQMAQLFKLVKYCNLPRNIYIYHEIWCFEHFNWGYSHRSRIWMMFGDIPRQEMSWMECVMKPQINRRILTINWCYLGGRAHSRRVLGLLAHLTLAELEAQVFTMSCSVKNQQDLGGQLCERIMKLYPSSELLPTQFLLYPLVKMAMDNSPLPSSNLI